MLIVCTKMNPLPRQMLDLMSKTMKKLTNNKFNNTHWLQSCGCAMGTKVAVAFSNIFMAKIEEQILERSQLKPLGWKRFIDDIASIWEATIQEVEEFIKKANQFHPTIKFMAEISDTRATFLDTTLFKGARFKQQSILDIKTHFKPTEKFQYTHFRSSHPSNVKKGFVKGKTLRLLRTCSSKEDFESNKSNFQTRLINRDYQESKTTIELASVDFETRSAALRPKPKANKQILPFVTTFNPATPNIKSIIMDLWYLIQNQPKLNAIFPKPPIISYRKVQSLKDMLVRAKL